MICPKCEYEYVAGINKCADCGEDLIPFEDFEGNLTHPKDYVIVHTCSQSYEADMIKANLAGGDIDCLILSQKDSSYPSVGDLAIIKLLVKKDNAEDALAIINDINKQSTNTD